MWCLQSCGWMLEVELDIKEECEDSVKDLAGFRPPAAPLLVAMGRLRHRARHVHLAGSLAFVSREVA